MGFLLTMLLLLLLSLTMHVLEKAFLNPRKLAGFILVLTCCLCSDSIMVKHKSRINPTVTSQYVNSVSNLCLVLGELPEDEN